MRIIANAGELAGALALVGSCADDKYAGKNPSRAAVYLKAAANALTIYGNDLAHALRINVPAVIEIEGEVAVSASRLAALASSFSDDADIEIAGEGTAARVGCG